MLSYAETGDLLDAMAEELPEEFFNDLNGGIVLLPQSKLHPESGGGDVYILGEYHRDAVLGRRIVIYYGSFEAVYPLAGREAVTRELRKTLRHEFTHHIESLAGERGLERKDEEDMLRYYFGHYR
ncbi:MAG: metallopeptidase family protein [Oscillospiraceae bacterium]|jgi:hypothetical protein|nr:metallopeptidase family protein [Oscillospiraceae bacterium]